MRFNAGAVSENPSIRVFSRYLGHEHSNDNGSSPVPLIYSLLLVLFLYVPWISSGYVNYEFPVEIAARVLSRSGLDGEMKFYFLNQANPLGYSIFLSFIYRIFGYHDWQWLTRVPSLFGACLSCIAGWMLFKRLVDPSGKGFLRWSLLVLCNPLFFVYSTKATADVLPVGLVMMSFALASKASLKSWRSLVLSGVFFGLSVITKYNMILLAPALCAFYLQIEKSGVSNLKRLLRSVPLTMFPAATIFVVYTWWVYARFGVFLIPDEYALMMKPNFYDLGSWILTLGKYLAFLGVLIGPSVLVQVEVARIRRWRPVMFMTLIFIFGWFGVSGYSAGEMDFGSGTGVTENSARFLESIGLVLIIGFVLRFRDFYKKDSILVLFAGLSLVPFLIFMSFSRPTQRYLLVLVPIMSFVVVKALLTRRSIFRQILFVAVVSSLLLISMGGSLFLRVQGNSAEKMSVWISDNGLAGMTNPGAITPHSKHHFLGQVRSVDKYEVVIVDGRENWSNENEDIHVEKMSILGFVVRNYVLRKI